MADITIYGCVDWVTGIINFDNQGDNIEGCMNFNTGLTEITIDDVTYEGCIDWDTGLFQTDVPGDIPIIIVISHWTEVAPQLIAGAIRSLVVYNDKIYGGTDGGGSLYEWNGTDAWISVAPQLGNESNIYSLVVYNNKIYGGGGSWGRLFEWNGTDAWVEVAPTLDSQTIRSLVVYNNKIYCGTTGGRLLEWNGTDAWVQVAPILNAQGVISSLVVYNNKIYGGTQNSGRLFEWNGTDAWVQVAGSIGSEFILSIVVHNNKIYGTTGNGGRLFEWNGTDAWVSVAPKLGDNIQVIDSVVYGDKLYGGTQTDTSDGGNLLEWNGTDAWTQVCGVLNNQNQIRSLVVYNNRIYGGTKSGGRLFRADGGKFNLVDVGSVTGNKNIDSMKSFNGKIYVGESSTNDTADARLMEWNGTDTLSPVGTADFEDNILSIEGIDLGSGTSLLASTGPSGNLLEWNEVDDFIDLVNLDPSGSFENNLISSIIEFEGEVYGIRKQGNEEGSKIVKYDGVSNWDIVASLENSTNQQLIQIMEFNGIIYAAIGGIDTNLSPKLYKLIGSTLTTVISGYAGEKTITSITSYNGYIYGTTDTDGLLLRSDGVASTWTLVADQLGSQIDLNSAVYFDGYIYAGSTPYGRLLRYKTTSSGWEQASRDLGSSSYNLENLEVLDGQLYATSNQGTSAKLYRFE